MHYSSAAVVMTIEAISESTIMIAENSPKVLNSPIEEVAIIAKPATSEIADLPMQAQAPPTPCNAWR